MNNLQFSLFNGEFDEEIFRFRESITSGFNTPKDIIPYEIIDKEIDRLRFAIIELQHLSIKDRANRSIIDVLKGNSLIFEVIRLILALPKKIGLANGLELIDRLPENTDLLKFVELLDEIHFWELISQPLDIESLVRVALIGNYAQRRPYQVLRNVGSKVDEIIFRSVAEVKNSLNQQFEILPPERLLKEFPPFQGTRSRSIKRGIDYVVAIEGRPVSAVKVIFLTDIGGSQLRDLRNFYPNLQNELNTIPMQLILIADGQGFIKVAGSVLQELFQSVHTVISIDQAEKGYLTQALIQVATEPLQRLTPIDRIIESLLDSGERVLAEELPVSHDQARLELAQFVNLNPKLALNLTYGGELLHWSREDFVRRGIELTNKFNPKKALKLFCDLLDASIVISRKQSEIGYIGKVSIKPDAIIPNNFLVVSNEKEANSELLKQVAQKSLKTVPGARIAVLLTSHDQNVLEQSERRLLQSIMSANVVTIDSSRLLELIKDKNNPRDGLAAVVLEQSDLTKISPFVQYGATPRQMYFGRKKEEAAVLSTLSTNSVALLGSRRIGKTSLMLNATESLKDGNFSAFFGDCQTVKNWSDFGDMAQRRWNVELPQEFEPQHLFELVLQLSSQTDRNIVILLDEIDQLLDWDVQHHQDQVPEAFFRACRTISQEGKAQFVFSGERTIAKKLWDPHSPHWNFCRALPLQQLDREATNELIVQPLKLLQVQISNTSSFQELIWKLTSGHPQIVQYLGDKLVKRLNERKPEDRGHLSIEDIYEIAETYEFKEHYVTTYWGQATDLEKLISLLIVQGIDTPSELISEFQKRKLLDSERKVIDALKVLDLYGILRQEGSKYKLRAEWFVDGLSAYGKLDQIIERHWEKI